MECSACLVRTRARAQARVRMQVIEYFFLDSAHNAGELLALDDESNTTKRNFYPCHSMSLNKPQPA